LKNKQYSNITKVFLLVLNKFGFTVALAERYGPNKLHLFFCCTTEACDGI